MSKYIKDQEKINDLLNSLTPEMISEFVHNFGMYEQQIRQYKGQYIDSNLFLDKIRNMLLKNVNLKYPQTRNLNSAIDASNNPDIEMQKAFESKVRAVEKPISEDDINKTNNLQDIEKIIDWIGNNKKDCNMYFELFPYVTQIFLDVGINLDRIDDNLRSILTSLSEEYVELFDKIYFDIENIYTGKFYYPKNQKLNNQKVLEHF